MYMKSNSDKSLAENATRKLQVREIVHLASNVALSSFLTTGVIAVIKLPIDKVLQELTLKNISIIPSSSIGVASLYTGLSVYMRFNLPRSCYLQYSKTSNIKPGEHEEVANSKERNILKPMPHLSRLINLTLFSAGETLFTHVPDQKTSLAQQNIHYQSNLKNNLNLIRSGLGLRYTNAFLNLLFLIEIQEVYAKKIFKDNYDSPLAGCISGGLSGISATFVSYPLKQLQMQICINAKVEGQELRFPKTMDLLKANIQELKTMTFLQTVQFVLPKLVLRSLQASLIFGVVSGMANLLGPTPTDDLLNTIYPDSNKPNS